LDFKEVIMFGCNHFAQYLPKGTWHVWDKLAGRDDFGDSFSDAEFIWHNKETKTRIVRCLWKGICGMETTPKRHHPSQKPLPVIGWCINQADNPQTILDPFAGSCTTARAAKDLGRRCVCIERELKYCRIGAERMRQEVLPL